MASSRLLAPDQVLTLRVIRACPLVGRAREQAPPRTNKHKTQQARLSEEDKRPPQWRASQGFVNGSGGKFRMQHISYGKMFLCKLQQQRVRLAMFCCACARTQQKHSSICRQARTDKQTCTQALPTCSVRVRACVRTLSGRKAPATRTEYCQGSKLRAQRDNSLALCLLRHSRLLRARQQALEHRCADEESAARMKWQGKHASG